MFNFAIKPATLHGENGISTHQFNNRTPNCLQNIEPFMDWVTRMGRDMEWVSGRYGCFFEKFWGGLGNGIKDQNICKCTITTALILSL